MKVHFIQQDPWVEPGEYLAWAVRNGYGVSCTRCWLHEEMPRQADADLLVVLGGLQCPATTKEECGYFDSLAEQRLIRTYVEAGRAVIGVCLGGQLLGEALGARYARSPEPEIGPVRARLTEAGRADPFLQAFPDSFDAGAWHNDMPGLTADAVILAESDGCPRQIVRYGRYAYAFQTHMEFTHEIIAAGLEDLGGRLNVSGRFVQTEEALLAYDYTDMNRLLSSFLDALMDDYTKQGEQHGTAELPTERLLLRRYRPEDAEELYEYFGKDPAMSQYSGWNPYAAPDMARETVARFIASYDDPHFYGWAIERGDDLVGTIGAYDCKDDRIEVGLSIKRDCWGRGYAAEALKAALRYLTEKERISCVTAWCAADNIGSGKAMEKVGMRLADTEKGGLTVGDKAYDKLIYEYRKKGGSML